MRIGIDVTGLSPQRRYTGMGEYAYQLISHLADFDQLNNYFLISYAADELPDLGPNFQRVALPKHRLGKFSALFSHQIALPRLARKMRLEVLHVPWVNVRPRHPAIPWRAPCPLVVTLHDVIPLAYYRRYAPDALPWRLKIFYPLNLRLANRAACLITVSESAHQDIAHFAHIASSRVTVIYNGINFPPVHLPADVAAGRLHALGLPGRYLLYAGSYEPRKNLRGVLAGYAGAVEAGIDLPLAMIVERESGYKPALREYVKTLNLAERLIFLNSLPQFDLRLVYSNAELFLFPSFYEGFGFPPLQAMMCGVPVIAARTSSLPEVLGDAACYVDPHQPEEITQAILELLTNRAVREQLATAGPAHAARYTWRHTAAETLAVYRRAAICNR